MGEGEKAASGGSSSEKRTSRRYDVRLPVELSFDRSGASVVITATTKDVSDEGAFLVTDLLLPEGTRVSLDLQLEIDRLFKLIGGGRKVQVSVDGTVVRNEHHGLAVAFGRKVSFRPT